MPAVRHLEHAPIREAVLDVRIHRPRDLSLDELRHVADSLEGFGEVQTQFQIESGIELRDGTIRRHDQAEPVGFRVASPDGARVVQLKASGFSFSRLQPYTSWEEIKAAAEPLLGQWATVVGTEDATRIALRYINHLRLPYPLDDLSQYVLGLPALPSAWPETVESFLHRVTLSEASGASVHVTHALVDDVDEDRIGIIFDIDAFREESFRIGDEAFWGTFEELRDLKNRIFFEGITDRTVEMYA